MSWVSKDKVVWLKKRGISKRFPHHFPFTELKLVLERDPDLEDRANSKEDLGKEVADAIFKANKDFLDDLDVEDEGPEVVSEEKEEDCKSEAAAVKIKILKSGGIVFGKKPKNVDGRPRSDDSREGPDVKPRGEVSDYEKLRLKNMKEREAMFKEMKEMAQELKPVVEHPTPKTRPTQRTSVPDSTRTEPVNLRTRRVRASYAEISDGLSNFHYNKRFREEDEASATGGGNKKARKRRPEPSRRVKNPNVDVATPDDITDEMLENVCDHVSEKVFSSANGTSCHQCRQKTLDTKTICRSGFCRGVKGAFCGVCLRNRYGQDAREALLDPNWQCPVCRDKCNCSICRNRRGKAPTGVLASMVHSRGHDSVEHFLDSLVNRNNNVKGDKSDNQ